MENMEMARQAAEYYLHYCDIFGVDPVRVDPRDLPLYAEETDPDSWWCEELYRKDHEFLFYLAAVLYAHAVFLDYGEAVTLRDRMESDLHIEHNVECCCEYSVDYDCPCCCDCPYDDEEDEEYW